MRVSLFLMYLVTLCGQQAGMAAALLFPVLVVALLET